MEKVSFIATVFNEVDSIQLFLDSILAQTRKPDEVIIVDAGSTDGTEILLKRSVVKFQAAAIPFIVKTTPGNRSVGRNTAIGIATSPWIAASDAGCILDSKWLEYLLSLRCSTSDVVSGFYSSNINSPTSFQKALAAYTCVMPDRLDEQAFLPSSRSIAFTKQAWEDVGGYPEELDTCEDLIFAERLKAAEKKFCMVKEAIVYWQQKKTLKDAAKQLYGYAYGDGQAGYIRFQTPLLYGRYLVGLILFVSAWMVRDWRLFALIGLLLVGYIVWAIQKNYRYVQSLDALFLLPLLQFTADFSVMGGMVHGLLSRNHKAYEK